MQRNFVLVVVEWQQLTIEFVLEFDSIDASLHQAWHPSTNYSSPVLGAVSALMAGRKTLRTPLKIVT